MSTSPRTLYFSRFRPEDHCFGIASNGDLRANVPPPSASNSFVWSSGGCNLAALDSLGSLTVKGAVKALDVLISPRAEVGALAASSNVVSPRCQVTEGAFGRVQVGSVGMVSAASSAAYTITLPPAAAAAPSLVLMDPGGALRYAALELGVKLQAHPVPSAPQQLAVWTSNAFTASNGSVVLRPTKPQGGALFRHVHIATALPLTSTALLVASLSNASPDNATLTLACYQGAQANFVSGLTLTPAAGNTPVHAVVLGTADV